MFSFFNQLFSYESKRVACIIWGVAVLILAAWINPAFWIKPAGNPAYLWAFSVFMIIPAGLPLDMVIIQRELAILKNGK